MAAWKELYTNGARNTEIAVSSKQTFAQGQSDRDSRGKNGSHNKLIILNSGTKEYKILLNGQDTQGQSFVVPSTGSFQIDPDEGKYFDFVVIENESAAEVIPADDLTLVWATAQRLD